MGQRAKVTFIGVVLALAVAFLVSQGCCGKSPTTPEPPPPPTQYAHALTVQALTLHTDSAVSGTVQVTMRSSGQVYNGSIGQKIALATTTKQEESCDILITATDCLPREFTEAGVKDSMLSTNLVEMMSAIYWEGLFYIMPDGINRAWVPRKFEVYFNPDYLTGLRLDQAYIDPVKTSLLFIQANSKGWIQTVTFHEDGTKPYDPTVPPDGEIWVLRESNYPGGSNVTYPANNAKVMSAKLYFNQSSWGPDQTSAETYDGLFAGEQMMGNDPTFIGPFYMLMLNRPRDTNNYIIST